MSSNLESTIDNLELWIWHTNHQGRFTYSHTPSNNWLGYADKELISLAFADLVVVENSPSGKKLQRSIENNERLLLEIYLQSAEGERIPVMICAKPQFDRNKEFVGYKGIATKISKENLEEFEENTILHYLVDTIGAATIALSPKGEVQYINDEFTKLFGYTREEIIGLPASVLEPDDDPYTNQVASSISILEETGNLSVIRSRRNKKGEEITVLIRGKTVRDHNGEISHFVASYSNISELVEVREKLEQTTATNLRLDQKVQELQEELSEYQRIGKIGSWRLTIATGEVTWTEELYIMLGLNPLDPPPNFSQHKQLFTEESFALLGPAIEEARTSGKSYELELEYIAKTGRHGWMLARGEAIRDTEGKVTALHGIVMDITHRKEIEAKLKAMYQELEGTLNQIVGVISRIVEYRDPYTAGHQNRVAIIATAIAKKMKLSKKLIRGVDIASQLHDIGKISVPAEILAKPGFLTEEEFSLVKEHSDIGYHLLKDIHFPWPVAEVTRQHHERLDGSGYPKGLLADDILLQSRIVAVADVVESMLTHRPYRPALGIDQALAELKAGSGSQFDADVVTACISLFEDDHFSLPEPGA